MFISGSAKIEFSVGLAGSGADSRIYINTKNSEIERQMKDSNLLILLFAVLCRHWCIVNISGLFAWGFDPPQKWKFVRSDLCMKTEPLIVT